MSASLKAFWQFARPHTIIGTTLSVIGLYLIALAGAPISGGQPLVLVLALLSCLAANVFIVGLNQLTDVEIDRINKPELPLASGAFAIATGTRIVGVSLGLALLIAATQGAFLLLTVAISLFIGTAYSLPPFRLKRFHFWAAACIFTVRGVVVNLLLYLHFAHRLTGAASVPPAVWALTAFIFCFSFVIAWFKDIPDMEGDQRFQIATLTLKLGPQRVFHLGLGMLALCYLGLVAAGLAGLPGVHSGWLIATHLALLALTGLRARNVDPALASSMTSFYMFVWTLFFAEYLVFPVASLMAG